MFTEERHKYILDLLDRNGKIFVKDLIVYKHQNY